MKSSTENIKPKKIILLGSGGLSIGQAGEFDYSGSQAIKALNEQGIEVIVINPNIATVQTDPGFAHKVYLYPVEAEWVEKVIEKEKPDGIIAGFGGQTALNCLLQLDARGSLQKFNLKNYGSSPETVRVTEDRDLFAKKMQEIGIPIPPSSAVSTLEDAIKAADKIGYPLIVRAAFALGGLGSGFANNEKELAAIVAPALITSPQVLLEKSLKGWKELEYEVMQDKDHNSITICNMENIDPLGIHTGDSIVVAPSQTLSDDEYQTLRNASLKIVKALNVLGECNVQFALDPNSLDFFVIEVNARLSRSSALASKASGYPIAYIAAKVVTGKSLLDLKNPVTGTTCAYFEPALDYIIVKVPRWDMQKFRGASRNIGSAMKSVGEIMAIGRNFPEAFQKAFRMVTEFAEGLSLELSVSDLRSLEIQLSEPIDTRMFSVFKAIREGMTLEKLHQLTKIDHWFLQHFKKLTDLELSIQNIAASTSVQDLTADQLHAWKLSGFGDEQIAYLFLKSKFKNGFQIPKKQIRELSFTIRKKRIELNIKPFVKKIDTTAGEHPSSSNYLYCTYAATLSDELKPTNFKKSAIVLGSGAYRVGTSVEFDWCAVSACRKLGMHGWKSVMINCNPETVSTDYNSSERLYFEEMTIERILDIAELEKSDGVIVSMGGQLPNRLALHLAHAGLKLLGHSYDSIDMAEDRSRFSKILDDLKIDQPRWTSITTKAQATDFVKKTGFPLLVRPSYVLSGAAMNVAHDEESMNAYLDLAIDVSPEYPVVLSEFLEGAREIELDGVAKNGEILSAIVSEHVENAGVHSGDATMVVPAQKLYVETVRQVRKAGRLIAQELKLNGPFNIQFLARHNKVKVIECNARASRSFPFVSKVMGSNLAELATEVMIGTNPIFQRINEDDLTYVGVKNAMFSFSRLIGVDPVLGVEMASTGEVGCIATNFAEALLLAMQSSGTKIPQKGVLVSAGREHEKMKFLWAISVFRRMGLKIYATAGTAQFLTLRGYPVETLAWPGESSTNTDVIHAIQKKWVDLVINIPKNLAKQELTFGSQIRQTAVRNGCSLITNMEKVIAFVDALDRRDNFIKTHQVTALPEYRLEC